MELPEPFDANAAVTYLEWCSADDGQPDQRIVLDNFPFVIGRGTASNLTISKLAVSKKHAIIERHAEGFRVRDLGSTNGTFVNAQRVTESPLVHDDILHVAQEEFRFVHLLPVAQADSICLRTHPLGTETPSSVFRRSQHLNELLDQQAVRVIYQPIVSLVDRQAMGYEALARGTHTDLSVKPYELLQLAEKCSLASALSQLFRQAAVQEAATLPLGAALFLNLHSTELADGTFLGSLPALREQLGTTRRVVMEFPETAVTDLASMREVRARLREFGFQIAYDDFGAGQARILELAEASPDYIKLDLQLIRNLHQSESRQNLLRALIQVGNGLNVQFIAEGIETREEAQICHELGCQFGQGYWFGRPSSPGLLLPSHQATCSIDLTPLVARLSLQEQR